MRNNVAKKVLAGVLSAAMLFSAAYVPGTNVNAAEKSDPVFTKPITANDMDGFTKKYDNTSNIGEAREITLYDGTGYEKTMTVYDNGSVRKEISSPDLADDCLGVGWNLGNTMEATMDIKNKQATYKALAESEDGTIDGFTPGNFDSSWGNPETTQALFNEMASFGINTIRIPVAWANGDCDDGTHTINPLFMDRVEEVVNMALNCGMYVVINDHWDSQWWGGFGACKNEKTEDNKRKKVVFQELRDDTWERFESYWTQISEHFKDYSDHLIFEAANEELGARLNDAIVVNADSPRYGYCTNGNENDEVCTGNFSLAEQYETILAINNKFIETVRATGGNNTDRYLLIPGYDTNIAYTTQVQQEKKTVDPADVEAGNVSQDILDQLEKDDEGNYKVANKKYYYYEKSRYTMPTDVINEEGRGEKLILSVHYYTPWDFCGDGGSGAYAESDQETMQTEMAMLTEFLDGKYGVIIGEGGVCNPGGVTASVTQWFYDAIRFSSENHACQCMWDTGAYFDRSTGKISYKDVGVFLNAVNGTEGDLTDVTKYTGNITPDDPNYNPTDYWEIPSYIDENLWRDTSGAHAYISYQMSPSYAYRDPYTPQYRLSNGKHSWEFASLPGDVEYTAENQKVTDVLITGDGEYTLKLEGIDFSSEVKFNYLGISTDILRTDSTGATTYNVKISDVTLKVDGKEIATGVTPTFKTDWAYAFYTLINDYEEDDENIAPLAENNDKEIMPTESIEITFTVSGMDELMKDIESGTYLYPETGKQLNPDATPVPEETEEAPATESPAANTEAPAANTDAPAANTVAPAAKTATPAAAATATPAAATALKVGDSFEEGNFKYTVKEAGVAEVSGLTAAGKKANKLNVAASVTGSDKVAYTVKSLGNAAFKGAKAKAVVLNKNITAIPAKCFMNCKALKTLKLNAKLKSVKKNAFKGCKKKIKIAGKKAAANKKLIKKAYKKVK